MNKTKQRSIAMRAPSLCGATVAILVAGGLAVHLQAQPSDLTTNAETQTMTTKESKFYCNIKALNPSDLAHHKQLTDKLIAARKNIVETPNGYEFQFDPAHISVAEVADWVAAEGKCCPFFDFHIDLEREASLLCLRLTGSDGIKPFIRVAFQVPTK